jgi:hypothetical protein
VIQKLVQDGRVRTGPQRALHCVRMSAQPWQRAFLGVSAVLGEPLEASLVALGDAGTLPAAELLPPLQSPSREVRALAIARALAAVLPGLDEIRLR